MKETIVPNTTAKITKRLCIERKLYGSALIHISEPMFRRIESAPPTHSTPTKSMR
jgi:hypothetical protein